MAEKITSSTYHISAELGTYEVARSNFFTFVVEGLDRLVHADFALGDRSEAAGEDVITNGQEIIKLSVSKASVPHFAINPIEVRRGNSIVKYAGNPSFDAGSLELEDFVGLGTKDALMAWQAAAYDVVNDKGGRASEYKHNCTLIEYTQDHEQVRYWELVGCWISAISESEFDVSADGDRKINVTLQFDRAIPHRND